MRSRKGLTFIAIGLLFVVFMNNFFHKDLWEVNESLLKNEILSIEQSVETIDLLEVTPFEWDLVYSFTPYTPKEKIYEIVGYEWAKISETVSEGMNQIVFIKDEKVVCYLYGYPESNGYGLYFSGESISEFAEKLEPDDRLIFQVKIQNNVVYLIND
ncbi:hypothetical protein JCM9140_3955 [Halalkalibacter wakoensis JCM 9140]|uniref:Uncharacterized protein n=1 Tax=Halalkalibacter wakoensis JCM 9140 TaxID=1236970 RepID=W4Q6V4_9BACI|nr:hypothetical protein [Halalkalibacter wakoensis]GAE27796.1 hypothetical protein JCM9140_3955 [Halalkalibacter wakoensis JCM 9140]